MMSTCFFCQALSCDIKYVHFVTLTLSPWPCDIERLKTGHFVSHTHLHYVNESPSKYLKPCLVMLLPLFFLKIYHTTTSLRLLPYLIIFITWMTVQYWIYYTAFISWDILKQVYFIRLKYVQGFHLALE